MQARKNHISSSRTSRLFPLPDGYAVRQIDVRRGYARWAEYYDTIENPLIALEEQLFAHFLEDKTFRAALDLGCGTGRHLRELAEKSDLTVGLDLSPEMLTKAQEAHTGIHLAQGNLTQLPFPPRTFDLVTANLVLEHVSDLPTALNAIARVLLPGSHAFITSFHPELMARGASVFFDDPNANIRYLIQPSLSHGVLEYESAARDTGFDLKWSIDGWVDDNLATQYQQVRDLVGFPLLQGVCLRKTSSNPESCTRGRVGT